MNADEIRAEAIGRIAQSIAADESQRTIQSRHFAMAEGAVDALGDMLPTGVEVDWLIKTTSATKPLVQAQRYVTAWQEMTE